MSEKIKTTAISDIEKGTIDGIRINTQPLAELKATVMKAFESSVKVELKATAVGDPREVALLELFDKKASAGITDTIKSIGSGTFKSTILEKLEKLAPPAGQQGQPVQQQQGQQQPPLKKYWLVEQLERLCAAAAQQPNQPLNFATILADLDKMDQEALLDNFF